MRSECFREYSVVTEPEEVAAIFKTARKDRSSKGLRDYAILMLLSTY